MTSIRILPDNLTNMIAAGEVVERPASVVKELVENALDAGAHRVIIELENGGKKCIRVKDDGCGMPPDDALLSIERFATSKIKSESDLFSIKTLGFRGEALPSIASVSRFCLITRPASAEAAAQIRMTGGKMDSVRETGAPPGTLVEVKNLFFNTPARRKFLRAVSTELGHAADTVTAMALGRPDVHFALYHNRRELKIFTAATPEDRVADALSAGDLVEISFEGPRLGLRGWVSPPSVHRATTRGLYIFVNNRYVKDKLVRHAVMAGYAGRLMKSRFPLGVLFLDMPFEHLDVNVHPTKSEVRYADGSSVHAAVENSVKKALSASGRPAVFPPARFPEPTPGDSRLKAAEPPASFTDFPPAPSPPFPFSKPPSGLGPDVDPPDPPAPDFRLPDEPPAAFSVPPPNPPRSGQGEIFPHQGFSSARVLGQLKGAYIVLETKQGLLLLDQHAAHERVVYEALKSGKDSGQSQKLLSPVTVDLSLGQADALMKMTDRLEKAGLYLEPFGGTTVVITSIPARLAGTDAAALVRDLAERAAAAGRAPDVDQWWEQTLQIMACHGAIRARQIMGQNQIKELLAALDACKNPWHCPHGRPTAVAWSLADIEKSFGRTG